MRLWGNISFFMLSYNPIKVIFGMSLVMQQNQVFVDSGLTSGFDLITLSITASDKYDSNKPVYNQTYFSPNF